MSIKLVKQNNFDQAIAQLMNKTSPKYVKTYRGPQDDLDNLNTVFGLPENTSGLSLELLMTESVAPYLFGGASYIVWEYIRDAGYKSQFAMSYSTASKTPKFRTCNKGVWDKWDDIVLASQLNALVEKVEISLTAETGFKITENSSYSILNMGFINCGIAKIDESNFLSSSGNNLCTIPSPIKIAYAAFQAIAYTPSGTPKSVGSCGLAQWSGKIYVCDIPATITRIHVSGQYLLR